jgi:putative transposase
MEELKMIATRVERHLIKKSNPMWKIVDEKCFLAKNLYNLANDIITEYFIQNKKWLRYESMDVILQNTKEYKDLGSQASQNTLTLLDKNWKSFFKSIKDWAKKNGEGYYGKPAFPKNKEDNDRIVLMIKNIQFRIENQKLIFSWKPLRKFSGIPTKISGKLQQLRFTPTGGCYFMEIIYQKDIPSEPIEKNRIIGIDLGINNFATIANNIGIAPIIINGQQIKSINQYYNKRKSEIQAETGNSWNKRMMNLTDKHLRKLDYFMHKASKMVMLYCMKNEINTLIVGKNDMWKNGVDIGKINNQNFVYIPYNKFIDQLKYKCADYGISFIITEESYTSGTSFLDDELPIKLNYNKKRRIKRGLFESDDGIKINADLNGAYQIIKKVFPNAFKEQSLKQWDRGCDLHPIRLNV